MKFYSVMEVTPKNDDWLQPSIEAANRLVPKHGGKYLARTKTHEQLEGPEEQASIRILIEWPSRQAALNFMDDPEYKPHLEARTKGSTSVHFLLEGDIL
ncbi:DUF1330 domain-containing protein [Roseibium sp. RKSG952]|uniref:DUF1330 domain-containing protein n=1 Tax=Roseibium sp. RKSG952 TaxID=2529384 RepID=UPI0012BCC837|nr:DUF1330 domain-containing protein [Roseibium sp. RKSG952]MTH95276.1 DUF1330 domain-containing protein [Roseibium sp. RKSG952]